MDYEVQSSGLWVGTRKLKKGETVEGSLFGGEVAEHLAKAGTLKKVEKQAEEMPAGTEPDPTKRGSR